MKLINLINKFELLGCKDSQCDLDMNDMHNLAESSSK